MAESLSRNYMGTVVDLLGLIWDILSFRAPLAIRQSLFMDVSQSNFSFCATPHSQLPVCKSPS
jgi:hypothetical protein